MQKSTGRPDTKATLILAAERLFAEKGIGTVSVRDITRAAGARNESALHYHFGNVETLIKEVFSNRFRQIDTARMERIHAIDAAGLGDDVATLMATAVGPLIQACHEENGRLYASFLVQLTADPRFDLAELVSDLVPESVMTITSRIDAALTHLPEEIRRERLRRAFTISVFIVADYARQLEAGNAPPVSQATREAGASLAGFLQAPVDSQS